MSCVGTRRWRGAGSRRGADGAARRGRGRPKTSVASRREENGSAGMGTEHRALRGPPAARWGCAVPSRTALQGLSASSSARQPGDTESLRPRRHGAGGRGRTGGGRAGAERSRTGAGRGAGGGAGGGGPVRPGPAPAGNSACCIYEKTSGGRAGWPRKERRAVPCRAAPRRAAPRRAVPFRTVSGGAGPRYGHRGGSGPSLTRRRQECSGGSAGAAGAEQVREGMGRVVGAFCTPGTPAGHPPAAPRAIPTNPIASLPIACPLCFLHSAHLHPFPPWPSALPSSSHRIAGALSGHPHLHPHLIPIPIPPPCLHHRAAVQSVPGARLSTRRGPASPGAGAQCGATAPGPAALLSPAASPRPAGHRIPGR